MIKALPMYRDVGLNKRKTFGDLMTMLEVMLLQKNDFKATLEHNAELTSPEWPTKQDKFKRSHKEVGQGLKAESTIIRVDQPTEDETDAPDTKDLDASQQTSYEENIIRKRCKPFNLKVHAKDKSVNHDLRRIKVPKKLLAHFEGREVTGNTIEQTECVQEVAKKEQEGMNARCALEQSEI